VVNVAAVQDEKLMSRHARSARVEQASLHSFHPRLPATHPPHINSSACCSSIVAASAWQCICHPCFAKEVRKLVQMHCSKLVQIKCHPIIHS
jgi:hypothetical protein